MTALIDEKKNHWNKTGTAETQFESKKFGTMYACMRDLIGLIEPRYKRVTRKDKEEEYTVARRHIFPPRVKYEREEWENFTS